MDIFLTGGVWIFRLNKSDVTYFVIEWVREIELYDGTNNKLFAYNVIYFLLELAWKNNCIMVLDVDIYASSPNY